MKIITKDTSINVGNIPWDLFCESLYSSHKATIQF